MNDYVTISQKVQILMAEEHASSLSARLLLIFIAKSQPKD
jgi:hypothetical protein